jgi:sugar-specific transcriptional regulator TrmB/DNA-binding CsgD family transcriptional regulator
VLGLSEAAERVYDVVLQEPGLSSPEVSRRMGWTAARGKDALGELETHGLVTRSASRPVRFSPTSPELALGILVRQREQELDRVRATTAQYQARFAQTASTTSPLDQVEVVLGRAAVLQRVTQLQRSAQHEILVLDTPPYAADHEVTAAEVEHLERGVRARVIYDSTALDTSTQLATVRRLAELGEEARIRESLPTKLMIADQRHAIVPLGFESPGINGVVMVHTSPLLDALIALFESLWLAATPVAWSTGETRTDSEPTDTDLLTLLAAGLKDDAIARNLGVSRRTVQRRIRRLMQHVGAQSRAQIVLQAARLGQLQLPET